jgi:aryl-alcohol dehydrogenase
MQGRMLTPLPAVLGHEGAGIVEAVGAKVHTLGQGDQVVLSYDSCAQCPSCKGNHASFCQDFGPRNFGATRPDGSATILRPGKQPLAATFFGQSSFATHAIARERNAVKVDVGDDLHLMGPLGCGLQTGAGAVINALKVTPGSSFAVYGSGAVGFAAILAALAQGAKTVIAVDLNDQRLEFAKTLGATHTFNGALPDLVDQVKAATDGRGTAYARDTTGAPPVIRNAVAALAPMGACAILGAAPPGAELSFDYRDIMVNGKRLQGVMMGNADPETFIPYLIDLWRQGRFPFDRLLSFYPFHDINAAIAAAEDGSAIKPVLRMS